MAAMKNSLSSLKDKDGLIPVAEICAPINHERAYTLIKSGEKIYLDPVARGVADVIFKSRELQEISKLRFTEQDCSMKGARIFGLPFQLALENAKAAYPGSLLKSIFKRIDLECQSGNGVCATLVTHIQKTLEYIQIEAWQCTENNISQTYYLHGIIKKHSGFFEHLDGATIDHSPVEVDDIFERGNKSKGVNYEKKFRIDGVVSRKNIIEVATAFFPNDDLTFEYFEESVAVSLD